MREILTDYPVHNKDEPDRADFSDSQEGMCQV